MKAERAIKVESIRIELTGEELDQLIAALDDYTDMLEEQGKRDDWAEVMFTQLSDLRLQP